MGYSHRLLATVIIAGLVARVAYVLAYPQLPVGFDAAGYDSVAMTIVTTGEYPAVGRQPLYPGFLAAIYSVFGQSYPAVRVIQAILVSAIAVFAFLIGRASFGHRQGVGAAAVVSLYPGFFAYSGLLLTETVFALLVVVFGWCFVRAWRDGRWLWPAAAGVVLGLATLCRGEIVGLAAPAALLLVWRHRLRVGGHHALALVAAAAVVIAPWGTRQHLNTNDATELTNGIGTTLWLSTYPGEWLEWDVNREPLRSLLDCKCSSHELNMRLIQESWRNVATAPAQNVWMSVKRFGRFWIGSHSGAIRGLEMSFRSALANGEGTVLAVKGMLLALNLGVLAAAVWGWYKRRKAVLAWVPPVMIIGYVNLVHVVLFSTSRYQIPIIPLVAVLAACAVDRVPVRAPLQ